MKERREKKRKGIRKRRANNPNEVLTPTLWEKREKNEVVKEDGEQIKRQESKRSK